MVDKLFVSTSKPVSFSRRYIAPKIMTRQFVPPHLKVSSYEELEPLFESLLSRSLATLPEVSKWIYDFSELTTVVDDYRTRLAVDVSCHTDDEQLNRTYMDFVERIDAKLKPLYFELKKKIVTTPLAFEVEPEIFSILMKSWQHSVKRYSPQNVPLETQESQLINEYDKLCGSLTIEFDGVVHTPQQMRKYFLEPDRSIRQKAWETTESQYYAQKEAMDSIFMNLLSARNQMAQNSGFEDFRAFMWDALNRFDYTPADCHQLADSIQTEVMPLLVNIDQQRLSSLQLEKLRPWDMQVDPHNRPPFRPFDPKNMPDFVSKVGTIFEKISPALKTLFDRLKLGKNLDLDSRAGKQPGGYQCVFEEEKEPFIFTNAAGLQRDIETLLHEGGHAFHSMKAFHLRSPLVRSAPLEFCEVASMSMELLGADHLDVFYPDAEEALRAKKVYFEGILQLFPSVAKADLFQHHLYTHTDLKASDLHQLWGQLSSRFSTGQVDWSGYQDWRNGQWHKILHFFHCPFYYFEYAVAQLGALQVWLNFRQDREGALQSLFEAYALGGTRPLPELYEKAGLRFDFSKDMVQKLISAVRKELEKLSDS